MSRIQAAPAKARIPGVPDTGRADLPSAVAPTLGPWKTLCSGLLWPPRPGHDGRARGELQRRIDGLQAVGSLARAERRVRATSAVCQAARVASWRETASASAQNDLDELLNAIVPFAEQGIAKHGEFFPFGAAVTSEGDVALIAADPGVGDAPSSVQALELLYDGARVDAESRRAFAFAADVRANGGSAIRVELEHREGTALVIVIPYTRSRFSKKVTLGAMGLNPGNARVWAR